MKLRTTILILILLSSLCSFSQREAVNWYFGAQIAVDFNSGNPVAVNNGKSHSAGNPSSFSDVAGQVIIYSNGDSVWNAQHLLIPDATGIGGDNNATVLIIPDPGSLTNYYIFTVGNGTNKVGLHYSKIDMSLNAGMGGVVSKNIPVQGALGAYWFLTAAKHTNNIDWWIIVRRSNSDRYVSYLLTSAGLSTIPVFSVARYYEATGMNGGQLKFSAENSIVAASFFSMYTSANYNGVEISKFDASTGKLNYQFILKEDIAINHGIEFSPDGKFLYVLNGWIDNNMDSFGIFQYEISPIDSLPVLSTGVQICNACKVFAQLQLASDGKIYSTDADLFLGQYMSVIHDPWKKGVDCNFEANAVWLGGRESYPRLPNFPDEFLFRFVWQGGPCAGVPFNFTHRFIPEPDSIYWNFGDAGSGASNVSTLHNPVHIFSEGGTFEVHAQVFYPGGRIEETSRKVKALPAPVPDLGPDIQVCNATTLELDAGGDFTKYNWNGSFIPGTRYYAVSDTGTYWVKVKNDIGCFGSDTIRIYLHEPPVLDTNNLVILPTTCGGSRGSISGLTASGVEPITVEWQDVYGNFIIDGYNLINKPVGNYYLWATDGNSCTNMLGQFKIDDIGDVLIDSVSYEPSYCGLNNGKIIITAVSGLSDKFEYSIDDGISWVSNEGTFDNLLPDIPYTIRVRVTDSTGCQAVYDENPVILDDLSGPEVVPVSEPETDDNSDGTITLYTTGFGELTYILENGTPQSTAIFTGLQAGSYNYIVIDENGCSTEGTIVVEHHQGFILSAIAGDDLICSSQTLQIPVLVDNFNGVKEFKAILKYDSQKVTCQGYLQGSLNSGLTGLLIEDFPAIQEVVASWTGSSATTLQGMQQLFKLVFTPKETGLSHLAWDEALSYFTGDYGTINNVDFRLGEMQVNEAARVTVPNERIACEGEMVVISPVFSGTAPLRFNWKLPDGGNYDQELFFIFGAGQQHSGEYNIKVTDVLGCSDSISLTLEVLPNPHDWFIDTIMFENEYLLAGPAGYASYFWSTGDTLPQIIVSEEGTYSLMLTTYNNCSGSDSTYLKKVPADFPFLIPNAFTPNGDGLNDTFRPVTDYDRFSKYNMVIYNSWGQRIFETTNPAEGWNGKDAAAGVYVWVINYADYLGKGFALRGSVTVVR